jgi:hypothetical protein
VRAYTCSHRSPALAARVARAERFTFVAPNELRVPTSDASFPAHPRDAPHRVASLRIVRVDAIGTRRCGAVRFAALTDGEEARAPLALQR